MSPSVLFGACGNPGIRRWRAAKPDDAYSANGQLILESNFANVTVPALSSANSNGLLLAPTQTASSLSSEPTFEDIEQITYDNDGRASTEEIVDWPMLSTSPSFSSFYNWAIDDVPGNSGIGLEDIATPVLVSMSYNSDSQLTTVTRASGSNNASTNPTQVAGPSTTYSYDNAGRLSSETDAEGGTTLVSYTYSSYDDDARLLSETYSDSPGSTITSGFTYTATGEVASENDTGSYNSSAYTYTYGNTYDLNGNLTNSGDSSGPNNEANTEGSTSYLYDPDGNRLLAYVSASDYNDYIFDSRNRLANVIAPAATQSVNYTYNALNQRVQEQDVNGATTTYTEFDYDPAGNLIMQYNSSGMTDLYLPDATGGVAPLAHENSASVSWLLTDQNGSVQDIANANGTSLTYRALYDSFGQAEESSGTPSIFGFQGMMQSTTAPSGIFPLYYDNARWYDPATENFISQDPKGLGGGDTNLYRFVHNDPVNGMDPSGMDSGAYLPPSAEDVSDDGDDPFELASPEVYGPPAPSSAPEPVPASSSPEITPTSTVPQLSFIGDVATSPNPAAFEALPTTKAPASSSPEITPGSTVPQLSFIGDIATSPNPAAFGTVPNYAGTFLANMTPASAAALNQALIAQKGGDLTNAQAFSIPLTGNDAVTYLQGMGMGSLAVTPGVMQNGVEASMSELLFGSGPYFAQPTYAQALAANPGLGMTKSQYYSGLADQQNIAMARDVMQINNNPMINLYARLLMPTANLISISVMSPTMIPSSASAVAPGATAGMTQGDLAAEENAGVAGGNITGYTTHGLNQAISRDGVGVSSNAILDAVTNPMQVVQQSGGRTMFVGENATVITNSNGQVITTWANTSAGTRAPAGGN